jgi:3-phenylpropionate/trans-cinnamate dioxygenase ferredoxin reductase subunit
MAEAAISMRQQKFPGTITLLGDEPELPYERPPLTKECVSGDRPFERMLLRAADTWAERQVSLLTAQRVITVDPLAHSVTTADGDRIGYGTLIWATGGHARRLSCSGHDLAGVHSVRNRADVDRMMAELTMTERVVVIAGGYIGLEAAAVFSKLGKRVTILEALDRMLARVAGESLSRFYEAEHRARGVEVRLGAKVDCILEKNGRAAGVRLVDGMEIPSQMVIVGIGIIPAVESLLSAGAVGGNGVRVDEHSLTSLPDVYAVGDCALHVNAFAGELPIRLESVQNANDMAINVAKALTGQPEAYRAVPWGFPRDMRMQCCAVIPTRAVSPLFIARTAA